MVSKSCWLKRFLAAALALAPLTAAAHAQSSVYVTLGEPQKAVGKRNQAVAVKIPITVNRGYHVNSNTPAEDYLIPLTLTWTAQGALLGGEVTYPKPSLEKYEFSAQPLSVYTGSVELVAKFQVAPNATAGPGIAVGKLRYQACNDRACFPPKTVEVKVPYQVQ